MKNLILTTLFIIFTLNLNAQPWKFDGSNCDSSSGSSSPYDEWGTPLVVDGLDPITGSSDILNFWAIADLTHFYIAFDRVASGNSGFSYFINTDCDTTTGDTSKSGSEFSFFFSVQSGVVSNTILYEWDGSTYNNTGKSFEALLGKSLCGITTTDKLFFEMRFPFTDVFDLCDTTGKGCGFITVEVGTTTAGGSPNSATKDHFTVHIPFGVNLPPVATFQNLDSVACLGEEITFDGSISVHGNSALGSYDSIVSYEWDFTYDGVTFNVDSTGDIQTIVYAAPGTTNIALKVTDLYSCTSVLTQDIYSFKRPTALASLYYVAWPTPNCEDLYYSSKTSLDFSGLSNLTSQWYFGDGDSSILDSGLYTYPDCNDYTLKLVVTDPDNLAKCATDTLVSLVLLPVEMSDFKAYRIDKDQVQLKWVTLMEHNNKGWEVFKSKDFENWIQVDFIEGKRYSNYANEYFFNDKGDLEGVSFYRLRQVDFNGEYSFSKIISIEAGFSNTSTLLVYPNPTNDYLNLSLDLASTDLREIFVVNQFGETIQVVNIVNKESRIDFTKYASGIYFIQYMEGDKWISRKILKY